MRTMNSISRGIDQQLTLARIATARPRPTPRADPLPLTKTNTPIQKQLSKTNTDFRQRKQKREFSNPNSGVQTLEHWRILQHVRDDHKPVTLKHEPNPPTKPEQKGTIKSAKLGIYLTLLPRMKTCSSCDTFPSYQ